MRVLIVDRADGVLARRARRIDDERLEPVVCGGTIRDVANALESARYDAVMATDRADLTALSVMTVARLRQPVATRIVVLGSDARRDRTALDPALAGSAHRVVDKAPGVRPLQAMLLAMDGPELPSPLREVVGAVAALPSVAEVLDRLREVLRDPDSDARDIAQVVASDPGLAAKTLQLSNSAFVGARHRIVNLEQAAALLGRAALQQVLIASMAFSAAEEMGADPWLVNLARRHGASASAAIRQRSEAPAWAPAGALLMDIGMPLLQLAWPDAYTDLREVAAYDGRQMVDHERRRLGVTHAEAGAALIRRWGLPREIVRMVAAHHHAPLGQKPSDDDLGFVAHYLAQRGPETSRDPYDLSAAALAATAPSWVGKLGGQTLVAAPN